MAKVYEFKDLIRHRKHQNTVNEYIKKVIEFSRLRTALFSLKFRLRTLQDEIDQLDKNLKIYAKEKYNDKKA